MTTIRGGTAAGAAFTELFAKKASKYTSEPEFKMAPSGINCVLTPFPGEVLWAADVSQSEQDTGSGWMSYGTIRVESHRRRDRKYDSLRSRTIELGVNIMYALSMAHWKIATKAPLIAFMLGQRLNWGASLRGGMEIDCCDAFRPIHWLATAGGTRENIQCGKLLSVQGVLMPKQTFPTMRTPALKEERIFESSRICIDTTRNARLENDHKRTTFGLFAAIFGCGLSRKVTATAVFKVKMERAPHRSGRPRRRLGKHHPIGATHACAELLSVGVPHREAVGRAAEFEEPIIVADHPTFSVAPRGAR